MPQNGRPAGSATVGRRLTGAHWRAAYNASMRSSNSSLVPPRPHRARRPGDAVRWFRPKRPPAAPAGATRCQNRADRAAQNQKIEHIRIEDSGARVDEVRYGGQTQSITVQPKANVPAYEVLPSNN